MTRLGRASHHPSDHSPLVIVSTTSCKLLPRAAKRRARRGIDGLLPNHLVPPPPHHATIQSGMPQESTRLQY
jgi:hypothetical protein